jgi:hypothetical protein
MSWQGGDVRRRNGDQPTTIREHRGGCRLGVVRADLDHAAVPRSDRRMFHALSLDPSGVTAQDSA